MSTFQLGADQSLDDYGSDLVVWASSRTTEEFATNTQIHGQPFNVSILHFEAEAEDGTRYLFIRGFGPGATANQRLWLVKEDADHPEALLGERAYTGPIKETYAPDADQLDIAAPGREFEAVVSSGGSRMALADAGGEVAVTYDRLGPGVRYVCPGNLEDVAFTSEHFRVTGTVLGKDVTGLGAYEMCFGTPGTMYFTGKVVRFLERSYFHFGNVYEDGTFEYGHFCDGFGHFRWGYIVEDGEFVAERENDTWSPAYDRGTLTRASFSLGGSEFEWTTTGVVEELFEDQPISSLLGRVTRTGDRRKPIFRWGWMEARDPKLGLRG